jgi:hypothetical protein
VRPPAHVLDAFGVAAEPERLPGGMDTSLRCGDLVVKPLDLSVEEVRWWGALFERIESDGFRVSWLRGICDGWCAWEYLPGEHRERAWSEIIAVGERFHAAIAAVSRPSFLDRRSNHWAIGERVAWGELPAEEFCSCQARAEALGGAPADRRDCEPARARRPHRQRAVR